jgi:hypothetical protein
MLTPEEAAPIIGVPAAQLKRWAWDRVGPKNSGTRYKPRYHEGDLRGWKASRKSGGVGTPGIPGPFIETF